jgi:serine/threonine protein kinase
MPPTPPDQLRRRDHPKPSTERPPRDDLNIPTDNPSASGGSPSVPIGLSGPDASAHPPSASPATPPSIPADLAQHHRYRILELIESGGMGTVLKAQHLFLKRLVALKVVNQGLVRDWKMRKRFLIEMQAAAQLYHPNIVTVYDADVVGDTTFFVMELVDGVALHRVVKKSGPLPIREACEYAQQTAAGMQHALECNILHRDIKPNNLMLTPQGTIKILDFGLARYITEVVAEDSNSEIGLHSTDFVFSDAAKGGASSEQPKTIPVSRRLTSRAMGTPDFLAPEVALDPTRADVRADIYSLGCTLYFLLTGRLPFPIANIYEKLHHHCNEEATPLRELRPEIPERLAAIVDRMMAKSPAERYPTPADVIEALKPFAAFHRGTVLVVDDDAFIRTSMTSELQDQGFSVQTAQDGLEALNLLRNGPAPELILLDLKMPGMDGFQFLQEREADPALAAIPVVVMSGLSANVAGRIVGAVDFLSKPVDPREIAQQIQRYLAKE